MAGPPGPRTGLGPAGGIAVAIVSGLAILGSIVLLGRAGAVPTIGSTVVPSSPPIVRGAPPLPGHEIYGFVPYWEIDDSIAAHLRATDATTIGLFSVTHTGRGVLAASENGHRRLTGPIGRQIVADAHAAGRRVEVAWTSFGRDKNAALFESDALQAKVIAALVDFRAELGVDGVAVDVEVIDNDDIAAYGAFVSRLRSALRSDEPGATVTVTTGAGRQGAALALAATLAGADRIFLMGYDYRTAGSEPGASAPLARRDGADRSLTWSLDTYAAAGVPVDRTILGLPLYGLTWPTASSDVGSEATGPGDIWVPRRNLATIRHPEATHGYDTIEDVGVLAVPDGDGWQTIYYDTPRSLTPKLGLANARGLAGAGFWALGYERGLSDYTDLIAAFRAGRSLALSGPGGAPAGVP
ncbi:MAG: glycoside hydrolase family 18 protein [Chloroflexi bacterium]|nr:glycoside hydrolase family 18 protein [Chloroflexota bacterium]